MGAITIKLLAEKLNLSTATVSKALADSHEISVSTKQKVFELARKLNYVPNAYAGSLRGHRSKTIAVVIPEVADSFFSLALNGIEEVALANGYHTLIYLTHEKLEREKAILKELAGGRVDGALISVTVETDSVEHIRNFNDQLPIVFFDRVCPQISTAQITTNDFESSFNATQHLIEAGCSNIVLLSISDSLSIITERIKGFKKAVTDSGLNENDCRVINCTEDAARNYGIISNLLSQPSRPDGILATVEKLTIDIYLACQKFDINIPRDVKVISFSNQSSAAILNPALTTVSQPAFEMGRAAVTALLRVLKNRDLRLSDESTEIPSTLMIRSSTKG